MLSNEKTNTANSLPRYRAPDQFIGKPFYRLTVQEVTHRSFANRRLRHFVCRCECGSTQTFCAQQVLSGHVKSCGCLNSEQARDKAISRNFKHGDAQRVRRAPEYIAWRAMIQRCESPKTRNYKDYGGRGISVCKEWRESYEAFLSHVGRKPTPKHSLDRYPNPDGNYEPGNVRWATASEQQRNKRAH